MEHAEETISRLCAAFRELLRVLPRSGRSSLSLSKDMGVDRNLCQQITSATQPGLAPMAAVLHLPGITGLRLFADVALAKAASPQLSRLTLAAIDAYEHLVAVNGGTRASLIRSLFSQSTVSPAGVNSSVSHEPSAPSVPSDAQTGKAVYDAVRLMTGYDVDTMFRVTVLRPKPADATLHEAGNLYGLIGLRSQSGPVPLLFHRTRLTGNAGETLKDPHIAPLTNQNSPIEGLLESLSTQPFPAIFTRESDGVTTQFVDFEDQSCAQPIDLVIGHRWSRQCPLRDNPPHYGSILNIKHPARNLIIDVYLHRAYAARAVPSAFVSLSSAAIQSNTRRAPGEHLRLSPTCEVHGLGLMKNPGNLSPHASKSTQTLFEHLRWSPQDFVGYRCVSSYPLWGTSYTVVFDLQP